MAVIEITIKIEIKKLFKKLNLRQPEFSSSLHNNYLLM